MKKVLAILAAAVLSLSLCTGAFAADTNLALSGTAIAKDNHETWGNGIVALNDNNSATRWQSATSVPLLAEGTEPAALADGAWAGIEWSTAQTFNKLVLTWEDSGSAENFVIQTSNDGDTWTTVAYTNNRVSSEGDIKETDTVTLSAAATAKAVRIVIVQAQDDKNGNPSIYEFEVYNVEGGEGEGGDVPGGVESVAIYAVLFAAAAAAVVFTKKARA